MALIISPKTSTKAIEQLSEFFNLQKVPKKEARLELGNLNDNLFFTKIGKVPVYVILTGYGGATVGFAVAQYEKNYKKTDPFPEAYFLGSVLRPKRAVKLKLADIVIATETYGADEWTQSVYRIAKRKNLKDIHKPDSKLEKRILDLASKNGIKIKEGKIFCNWQLGYIKHSEHIIDYLNKGMWWEFALSQGQFKNHDFDGGEIESAAFIATCNLAQIPAVALFDVRDERTGLGFGEDAYRMASDKEKEKAQKTLIKLVKLSIVSNK